jgi:hypothetical protein
MISGVAQVIGMKPILSSRFSSEPGLSCAIACIAPIGRTEAIAARAVLTPTACKKRRRKPSCGNSALTSAASTKSSERRSALIAAPSAASVDVTPACRSGRSASCARPHRLQAEPSRR